MALKDDLERLMADPPRHRAFVAEMCRRATQIDVEVEILARLDYVREQLRFAHEHGRASVALVDCLSPLPLHVELCAAAVGAERGQRIGGEVAKYFIQDAHGYATQFVASNAPWLIDAGDT